MTLRHPYLLDQLPYSQTSSNKSIHNMLDKMSITFSSMSNLVVTRKTNIIKINGNFLPKETQFTTVIIKNQ